MKRFLPLLVLAALALTAVLGEAAERKRPRPAVIVRPVVVLGR